LDESLILSPPSQVEDLFKLDKFEAGIGDPDSIKELFPLIADKAVRLRLGDTLLVREAVVIEPSFPCVGEDCPSNLEEGPFSSFSFIYVSISA
jgi:hypothetical protein